MTKLSDQELQDAKILQFHDAIELTMKKVRNHLVCVYEIEVKVNSHTSKQYTIDGSSAL